MVVYNLENAIDFSGQDIFVRNIYAGCNQPSQLTGNNIPGNLINGPNATSVDSYGARGDGVTDDSSAFQTALNSTSDIIYVSPSKRYFVKSTLTIPASTFLVGSINPGDTTLNNGLGVNNILPMIILGTGATIQANQSAGVIGIHIVRQGVTLNFNSPTNVNNQTPLSSTWTNVFTNYSGTAISIGSGGGSLVRDCTITGHSTAISIEGHDRFNVKNVKFDCTSGILVDNMHDVSVIEDCLGNAYNNNTPACAFGSISAVTNFAGICRITLTSGTSSNNFGVVQAISNGMLVWVNQVLFSTLAFGPAGPTGCGGRYTASNVTATTIDLIGSVFASTATGAASGGVYVDPFYRSGPAYQVTSSEGLLYSNCFEYDHQTAYHVGNGVTWAVYTNCGCDGFLTSQDPTTAGWLVDGNAGGAIVNGGFTSSKGNFLNFSATGFQSQFNGVSFNSNGYTTACLISSGQILLSGCASNTGQGFPGITVTSPTRCLISGCDFHGLTLAGNTTNTTIVGSYFSIGLTGSTVTKLNLPTTNPGSGSGILWSSGGTLVVA